MKYSFIIALLFAGVLAQAVVIKQDEPIIPAAPAAAIPSDETLIDQPTEQFPAEPKIEDDEEVLWTPPKKVDKFKEASNLLVDEIGIKLDEISKEKKWVEEVEKIKLDYLKKIKKVERHVHELKGKIRELYKKKKQVDNLELQDKLMGKLKEAKDDMGTLDTQIKNAHEREKEFNSSKKDVIQTIETIHAALAKLRGQDPAVVLAKLRQQAEQEAAAAEAMA